MTSASATQPYMLNALDHVNRMYRHLQALSYIVVLILHQYHKIIH